MADLTWRVKKHRASDLREGEEYLKSIVGQPPGSKARAVTTAAEGHFVRPERTHLSEWDKSGKAVAAHNASIDDPLVDRVPTQNVYVTLTNQRMTVHTANLLGKPKDLVAEFSHDEIADVLYKKLPVDPGEVYVVFSDESVLNLDMQTRQDPDALLAAWDSLADS